MFKNWDWDDIWQLLAWTALSAFCTCILIWSFSTKVVTGYYLGEKQNKPVIVTMISNLPDEYIEVDRNIPLDSIVVIVNKLNNNLKHK